MKVFIPLNVDINSANIDVIFKTTDFGVLVIEFQMECNVNYDKTKNIKYGCIQINNVYYRQAKEVRMVITKTEVKNNGYITGASPGKHLLHDYPRWDLNPITIALNDQGIPYDPSGVIEVKENSFLKFYALDDDSCTIPPKN
jgi:hypothetical protein